MAAKELNYQKSEYMTSAAELKQLPSEEGCEVAFIGRSNAGKSSALNTITNIKGLARTSSTPGRTQMINLFSIENDCRLVDLPGYGYAKAPRTVQERWIETTNEYLKTRGCLRGLVLMMDIRHPHKESDQQIIAWTVSCGLPLHILLTKADKLSRSEQKNTLLKVQKDLAQYGDEVSVQIFSSLDKVGVEEARQQLNEWFADEE